MQDVVVKVEQLNKLYKLYDKPTDRLYEAFSIKHKKRYKEHYALRNISFDITRGETIGVIGTNGSGKSTLLKILTGVLNATSGNLDIKGSISALLELGAGFNPEYTGIENVYLNGTMLGFSKEEIDDRLDEIIAFADIGYFINQPVKTYSSGMFVRLAFAVAINVNPDILIVDEALSVGDIRFQQKCYRRIEMLKKDKTVIMVSHDVASINKFCDRVIWLEHGELMGIGDPTKVCKEYQAYLMDSKLSQSKGEIGKESKVYQDTYELRPIEEGIQVYGDQKAQVVAVGLFDEKNMPIEMILPDTVVKFIVKIKYNEDIVNPIVGFTINDRLGNIILQTNSYVLNQAIEVKDEYETYQFTFKIPELNEGSYTLSPAIASGVQEDHIQHNWAHDAQVFTIITKSNYSLQGILYMNDITFTNIE